jgi:hypothetical protein
VEGRIDQQKRRENFPERVIDMQAIPYTPHEFITPARLSNAPSAWKDCPSMLFELIMRAGIHSHLALDLGVDWGFSTIALSNFFTTVIGIDTFEGDAHCGWRGSDQWETVSKEAEQAGNILLVKMNVCDWIIKVRGQYDLCHVDLQHDYQTTYLAGTWAVEHSSLTLFHDIRTFPDVRRAVSDICDATGKLFYEWPIAHGLGIVTSKEDL